jgi:hypothetical protein
MKTSICPSRIPVLLVEVFQNNASLPPFYQPLRAIFFIPWKSEPENQKRGKKVVVWRDVSP